MTDQKKIPNGNKEIIQYMFENNEKKFHLLKAAEEFSELTTAILQYLNKDGRETTEKDIVKEIGDCSIRIEILKKVFKKKDIKKRITYKLSNIRKFIISNRYVGKL